ncbi:hypothetical protein JJJ10_22265 [Klebsiella grimontii]|uniref:hypothetical protein n=1 Tax=Klebsiella grimontii TaxID=2058152 RepID=UPI0015F2974D|nr:hypothetical protein [Klebsiella grimontii]MDM4405832.1 hypothetical protein [Klebsiella grimontii]QTP39140.1 hypothetical protein JJJ10_22265 [Klebsiella grimontii]
MNELHEEETKPRLLSSLMSILSHESEKAGTALPKSLAGQRISESEDGFYL